MYRTGIGLIASFLIVTISCKTNRLEELCSEFQKRRIYLEQGERGILEEKYTQILDNTTHHKQCSLELITCASCTIRIKFSYLNLNQTCGRTSVVDSCTCDYLWIYEPPFEQVSGEQFCGFYKGENDTTLSYRSQTRTVIITFFYTKVHEHAFTMQYRSDKNRQFLDGSPNYGHLNNASQFIVSPFFPYLYPRDLSIEYVINCHSSELCAIRLVFTDFQISPNSIIEFFDWNGQRIGVFTGYSFRPPIIFSTGPNLVARFYANGGTGLGYRAVYSYLLGNDRNSTQKPQTSCGGFVENLGGQITMMNMINEGIQSYDCFWIIKPLKNYLHLQTHLYLKIIKFSNFAGTTELKIRQGLTSNSAPIEILRHPTSNFIKTKPQEHVVSISDGFYISLRGLFYPKSQLAIAYSTFSYRDSDFPCQNHRCVPAFLGCDGFDHCGDNSDESEKCASLPEDHRWSHIPNFYFPKIDKSDLKTATVVFIVCTLGLIILICALVAFLCHINTRTSHRRRIHTHLQTFSDLLDEEPPIIQDMVVIDEPPLYEAPPNYEEIVKKESVKLQKHKSERRRKCNLNKNCSRCTQGGPVPDSPPPIYQFATAPSSSTDQSNTERIYVKSFSDDGVAFARLCKQSKKRSSYEHFFYVASTIKKYLSNEELGKASLNELFLTNKCPIRKLNRSLSTDNLCEFENSL